MDYFEIDDQFKSDRITTNSIGVTAMSDVDVATNKTVRPQPSFFRSFIDHPASVDESYWQHLRFAMRFAFRLLAAGGAAVVHAFIPALFETTASRMVNSICQDLNNRHDS